MFFRRFASDFKNILVEKHTISKICLIKLNRPNALNALCDELICELSDCLNSLENDNSINCVLLTGQGKAFAAGADIKELSRLTFSSCYRGKGQLSSWDAVAKFSKPIVAAVNGYALGGGCELAMMCDIIYSSKSAKFGQPEINLGTIPGAGGTQRLVKAIGKSKAMEMILTGETIGAEEALKLGLIANIFEDEELLEKSMKKCEKIASKSQIITKLAKDSVNSSFNSTLEEGLKYEKRLFYSTFSTQDQKIGMNAFISKEDPKWENE